MTVNSEGLRRDLDDARAELLRANDHARHVAEQVARLEAALNASTVSASPPRKSLPIVRDSEPGLVMKDTDKVTLFRSLFRGRDDVFPRRWANATTGRSGYAPACANEWVRGVCEKPRVKCGECPNRSFLSVDDRVIVDHLRGRQVLGVYPLLANDTCWFLAADFDGDTWHEDVRAFRDGARSMGASVSVERSRSGVGAHAWLFFSEPVSATVARQLGCFILTEAMRHRHQMPMRSYDRLFPNQDTLPKGGFGNLIALPLQGGARRQGNTVFLDEAFEPFTDQWVYLRAVERMSRDDAEALTAELGRSRRVIAIRTSGETGSESPVSLELGVAACTDPMPSEVCAVLADRLFVAKTGIPSPVLREIKNVAAFQNPEFYKRQNLRLYTGLTPRIIDCAEETPEHIVVPRGCLSEVEALVRMHGSVLRVEDRRELGPLAEMGGALEFTGRLRPEQQAAVEALLQHDTGVLVAPPGTGKTVIGAALIARRGVSTLILVHNTAIAEQWVAQLTVFLGITPGMYGAGKSRRSGVVDVAMLPSVVRKGEVLPWIAEYGHVVVDECHHVPAISFERVLATARARYVTGLTATPQRRDGLHPILYLQLGPVRHTIAAVTEVERRQLVPTLVLRDTMFTLPVDLGSRGNVPIQTLYALLAADESRNDLIFDDILRALEEGRSPIVLTERTDHLEYLAQRLEKFTRHLIVLRGSAGRKVRKAALAQLAAIPPDEERLVLATGRYAGEGFDDARLDTLFLVMPISWKGRLVQYVGRLHRTHAGKREVRVYDYVDSRVPVLQRMFDRRMRGYRTMGYGSAAETKRRAVASKLPTRATSEATLWESPANVSVREINKAQAARS